MIGDLHNGGQAVRGKRAPDGQFWFEKPRTVFWEKLFFGFDSPIRSFWSQSPALFQLVTESDSDNMAGRSRLIASSTVIASEAFYNFGYLLGYSYLFGIQDLFRENVVQTTSGVLPIDVEIVLSKFFLPHESALLPFKNVAWDRCALSLLIPDRDCFSTNDLNQVLAGYVRVLLDAQRSAPELVDVMTSLSFEDIPVRVLLRPTAAYVSGTAPQVPFLLEEQVQLAQGDVPYFFKFVGDEVVYYYAGDAVRTIESALPNQMLNGLKNIGVHPSELLSTERIVETLLPTGILYLLRALSRPEFRGPIEAAGITADITDSSITLTVGTTAYSCRR